MWPVWLGVVAKKGSVEVPMSNNALVPLPFLPYGRQAISEDDIQVVGEVLRSDWLTQGPMVPVFERDLCALSGAPHGVACSNGTAALHLAMLALELGPGDTILTTPITFLATANCARYVGADVRFADVDPRTGLMAVEKAAEALESDREKRIKAILPVHFSGQPVDLQAFHQLAKTHGVALVDDACHALGAAYCDRGETVPVGSGRHSDMTVFSFHPVKHVTTGEGGAVMTARSDLAERLQVLRTHGVQRCDFQIQEMATDSQGKVNPWYYEQQCLGFNYRLTDFQAALGSSQLKRLGASVQRRNELANRYHERLAAAFPLGGVRPLAQRGGILNAYHLFVVHIDFQRFGIERSRVMDFLKARQIGTQVHYIPVHLQPYYRQHAGTKPGDFPGAEAFYRQALSLPMYPELSDSDLERVVTALAEVLGGRT